MPKRRSATGRGRGRSEQEHERTGTRRAAGRTTNERTAPTRRGRGVARRGRRPSTASRGNDQVQPPTAALAEPVASSSTSSTTSQAHPDQTSSRVQTSGGASGNGEFLPWPIVSDNAQLQLVGGGPMAAATSTFGPPLSTQPDMGAHGSFNLGDAVIGGGDGQGVCGIQTHVQPRAIPDLSDDLGSGVQLALKERIWKGEYVELGQLLKMDPSTRDQSLVLAVDAAGGGLQLRPQSRSPAIRSVEQWTSAMLVFISIYAERHASRARELLKYVSVVRTAAECGYNWKDYDVQFRLRHARQPHMSWAKVDTELWLLVATAQMRNFRTYSNGQSSVVSPQRGGRRQFYHNAGRIRSAGAGICFAFNSPSGRCTRGKFCRYPHKCKRCGDSSHGAASCAKPSTSQ